MIANAKYVMYLTGQHNIVPELSLVSDVTHVALAFMSAELFNRPNVTDHEADWPLFTTVEAVRSKFAKGTAIMIAIGGWGDPGFSEAAASQTSRELFAQNVKAMVDYTGADGVDIDWEYPGGNGEDYKRVPNSEKAWEVTAYPQLLSSIRSTLGPSKIISAAVPGLLRDMLAFTKDTIPLIAPSLDFFNIMTYDLANRRDNTTKHHTGLAASLKAVDAYLSAGVPPEKANLGFAFYVKWFRTSPDGGCDVNPIGCKTAPGEDPATGADLGQTGAFAYHDDVSPDLAPSFRKAMADGRYDVEGGGHYYWDEAERIWWTWDTAEAIVRKIPAIVGERGLGGVFAWGLGEDATGWVHLKALTAGYRRLEGQAAASESLAAARSRDEL
ncbi:glycoside hydrolase superfamily [Cryomyces antarcticus]